MKSELNCIVHASSISPIFRFFAANTYHHLLSSFQYETMHFRSDWTRELKVLVGGNFSYYIGSGDRENRSQCPARVLRLVTMLRTDLNLEHTILNTFGLSREISNIIYLSVVFQSWQEKQYDLRYPRSPMRKFVLINSNLLKNLVSFRSNGI